MMLLVTGSRWHQNVELIEATLRQYSVGDPSQMTLIEGGAKGTDAIARNFAETMGWTVKTFEADWSQYGKAAGGYRNQEMVDQFPNICLAFPLEGSKGTWDCVRRAQLVDIPVVITEGGE